MLMMNLPDEESVKGRDPGLGSSPTKGSKKNFLNGNDRRHFLLYVWLIKGKDHTKFYQLNLF